MLSPRAVCGGVDECRAACSRARTFGGSVEQIALLVQERFEIVRPGVLIATFRGTHAACSKHVMVAVVRPTRLPRCFQRLELIGGDAGSLLCPARLLLRLLSRHCGWRRLLWLRRLHDAAAGAFAVGAFAVAFAFARIGICLAAVPSAAIVAIVAIAAHRSEQ